MIARAQPAASSRWRKGAELLAGGWQMLVLPFSDDDHANIFGLSNDLQNQIIAQQTAPGALFWTAEKDLRDLIAAGKLENRFRRVIAFQGPRLDVKISGEVKVFFDGFPGFCEATLSPARRYGNRKTICAQVVRPSAPPPDEHGGGRVGSEIDQNPIADQFL